MAKAVSIKKGIAPLSQQEYELLTQMYVVDGLSAEAVAKKLNISERTLFMRLKAHGISKKQASRARLKYCEHCGQALPTANKRIRPRPNSVPKK